MVNGHLTCILICITTSSLLWSLSTSQSVTRFSDNLRNDEFSSSDNSTCRYNGCVGFNGYKSCYDCCTCICNYGSYLTSKNRCVENNEVAKDCKFVVGDNAGLDHLVTMTPLLMKNGQNISYCKNNWDKCTTPAANCVINSSKTIYDNGKWKLLWPSESQNDFEIRREAGGSDSLMWRSKECNAHKYDGLLISLGVDCYVHGVATRVNSCLVLKFLGTFVVGNDPLMKANCTTTTAITQKLTTITQKLTTITSEQVKSTPTTIPASVTSQIVSAGDQPPVTPKASKSQVIIAVSLSVIALLVLIVIAVGIAAFRKRRRKHPSNGLSQREGKNTAHSSLSNIPAGETNNGLSDSAWTVDGNEGFVVIDRPPVFTVCIPEDIYDEPMMEPTNSLGEGLPVSNPSGQSTNMETGPLYSSVTKTGSSVGKGRKKIKSTLSNGIGEPVDNDGKIWLQSSFSLYSEPYEEKGSMDAIYDEPDAGSSDVNNASSSNDKTNEPVYMLYEPFHT